MSSVLKCERCGKKLSRKTARQINGVVQCAPCMFGQKPARPPLSGKEVM